MSKDRFKTRASYDTNFKYGVQEIKGEGKKRNINEKQVEFLKKLYKSKLLSSWEKNFIKSILTFDNLSDKQITIIKKIYNKIKTNGKTV
jgi:hypothetical protein